MTSFADLKLSEPLLRALTEEGYTTPTPIQAGAIPHLMQGRDLLGLAQTGTGKTAAFALPILHRLSTHRHPAAPRGARVLVLAPTRELATQIDASFATYARHIRLSHTVVFGGVGQGRQVEAMRRGVDVLVAAPGASARPDRTGPYRSLLGRGAGARRGRPHARHGLRARYPPRRLDAPPRAPDLAVLGDHAEDHLGTRQRPAARPGDGGSHPALDHRRADPPGGDVRRRGQQEGSDADAAAVAQGCPRDGVHADEA